MTISNYLLLPFTLSFFTTWFLWYQIEKRKQLTWLVFLLDLDPELRAVDLFKRTFMQESHLKIFHCKSMSATPSHIPRNPETKKINLNNFHLDKVVQQPDDVASARSSHHRVLVYQHLSLLTLPVVYCFCHSSAERRIKSKISQSACFLCAGPRQNTPPDCPPAPAEVFLFRLSLMDI